MDSFFFNITDTAYKVTDERVDISNGIVFLDIKKTKKLHIKHIDRLIMIAVVKDGTLTFTDQLAKQTFITQKNRCALYCSSRQDIMIEAKGEIFLLFIADFYLKRYLSANIDEPIDFLYHCMQQEISLKEIHTQPLDALSLYIIDKITQKIETMQSIRTEHNVIEFMIHQFSLLDIVKKDLKQEDRQIALKAKNHLLKNFIDPPTIQTLAHLCATNENKLKKIFKQAYHTTIYGYIQKLRLEEANILLKEKCFTIGEVAKAVGYKHQGHFSKLFFITYGIYPKELLKK